MSVRLDGIFHLWRIPTPTAFLETASLADRRWARSLGVGLGVHLGF
jgi:hypothetical protein